MAFIIYTKSMLKFRFERRPPPTQARQAVAEAKATEALAKAMEAKAKAAEAKASVKAAKIRSVTAKNEAKAKMEALAKANIFAEMEGYDQGFRDGSSLCVRPPRPKR